MSSNRHAIEALAAVGLLALSASLGGAAPRAPAGANGPSSEPIQIQLIGVGPGAGSSGLVKVRERVNGPDKLDLRVEGLPPDSRIAVFLTRHQQPGRLPAVLIGEFTTDGNGKGKLKVEAEIVGAFTSANQTLEDLSGEAGVPGSGDLLIPLGGTANTIPLNWIRGYFADLFPHNVFGPDELTPGGPPAFISAPALP